jgi:epoxide hydrolase-like predicted phosphatase
MSYLQVVGCRHAYPAPIHVNGAAVSAGLILTRVKAVIFDIGGVLERNPPTGWRERWALRLGFEVSELERRLDPFWEQGSIGALKLAQIEARTARVLEIDDARLTAFMDDAWTEYVGTLNHELARYFAGLRPRYRTAILSNSFVGAREREQAAYGFEDMCDVVVYSHEEGWMKPDPRIYRVACERLDVRPQDAVFLDDMPACVEGARSVGMSAVRFIDNEQAIAEVQQRLSGGVR